MGATKIQNSYKICKETQLQGKYSSAISMGLKWCHVIYLTCVEYSGGVWGSYAKQLTSNDLTSSQSLLTKTKRQHYSFMFL